MKELHSKNPAPKFTGLHAYLKDYLGGSLEGESFGNVPASRAACAGSIYMLMAIAALFFGV